MTGFAKSMALSRNKQTIISQVAPKSSKSYFLIYFCLCVCVRVYTLKWYNHANVTPQIKAA